MERSLTNNNEVAPADLTDSQLLYELSAALQLYARDAHESIPALIEVARDRAGMFLRYEERPRPSVH